MFKYVNDISELSHDIIEKYCGKFDTAIDATLGNGHDCDFLKKIFKKVYAFDIQENSINQYKDKSANRNVICICDCHSKIDNYITENIDCAIYNLGYLPGGDKNLTTTYETTLKSLEISLEKLNKGGIISIAIYHGHDAGAIEKDFILSFLKKLNNKIYGVMTHNFYNRSEKAPILAIIEKR